MTTIDDYIEVKFFDQEGNVFFLQIENYKENITLQEIQDNFESALTLLDGRWYTPQGYKIITIDSAKKIHSQTVTTELE